MPSSASNGQPPREWVADIFSRLEVPLVIYARRRMGGDLEAARDIVQEAFAKLCQQSWPEIELHATPWLYRTCRNRAIDLLRREGLMSTVNGATEFLNLQDRNVVSPDQRLVAGEQTDRLQEQLRHLSDQQQEILRLRLQDGLSYKQIAEVTGLTATNVGYHLHQAIVRLRTNLGATAE